MAYASVQAPEFFSAFSEVDEFSRSLSALNWPESESWGDVRNIDERFIIRALANFDDIALVTLVGGFPCKDTSRLKHHRNNLKG